MTPLFNNDSLSYCDLSSGKILFFYLLFNDSVLPFCSFLSTILNMYKNNYVNLLREKKRKRETPTSINFIF